MNLLKLKNMFLLSLLTGFLVACGSDSGGGSGKAGDLEAACDAENVDDFFAAMAGSFELIAVDTFLENEDPATEDDTFEDGESYKLTYSKENSLTIATEKGDVEFSFGDAEEDIYDPFDNVKYMSFMRDDVTVTTRVSCEEEEGEYTFFVAFRDPDEPLSFFWRLDQE